MTWNYRVLVHEEGADVAFAIHEVYYDDEGKPDGYTKEQVGPLGETIKELQADIDRMRSATTKPILYYGDRFPMEFIEKKPEGT